MKIIMKRILAFMLSAMMITVIPSINAAAEEVEHTDWCVEENGVLTWTFAGKMTSKTQIATGTTYNCGNGLQIIGSSDVQLETAGLKLANKATANAYEKCVKFTPNQNGVMTVEATSASTTLFVDTNVRDDLQKAYSGSEPSQLTLEAGVDYYIYNNSSTAVTITKITFAPDTTGATVWDLTNVNNRLENYATFTADDTYEYQGLTLTGGSSSSINKNGVKIYKNSGFIIYDPICSGTLSVRLTNSSNKTIYIDTNNSRQKTNTFANSAEGSKTVEKGQTYYIYNGDSADVYVKQLIFTPDTFTVTFDSDGGSEVAQEQVIGGQIASKPETPTKEHYTFSKWQLNDEDYDFDTAVTGDITLKAVWTPNKYTITWLDGDGSTLDTTTDAEYDTLITATSKTPTKVSTDTENYTFSAWQNFTEGTTKVTGNMTFTPLFTPSSRTYAVTAATELANGSVTVNKLTASFGDAITVTISPETGYQLASLTVGGEAVTGDALTNAVNSNSYTFNMPAKVVEVSATFERKAVDKVEVTLDNSSATHGTAATITATAAVYATDNTDITSLYASDIVWSLDETTTTANKTSISGNGASATVSVGAEQAAGTVTVTATVGGKSDNKAITVSSEPTYTITIGSSITGGTVTTTPSGSTTKGQTVTITAAPDDGYRLKADSVKVNDGAVTVTDNTFTMPESNVTVTAEFELKTYTITWNNDTNALIDTTTVEHGSIPTHAVPTKDATAQYTYTFAGWTPTIVAATANTIYTATFTPVTRKYTATFNLNGGNINGNTANVEVQADYNTAPTPPENPIKDGYTFNGWSPAVSAITANTTFTAQWIENTPDTVTVTFNAGQDGTLLGNSSKTITKGGTLVVGDIPAASKTGHTFDKWSDGTNTYTTAQLTELSINSDITFTATYAVNQYTITWNIEGAETEEQYDYNTMPSYKNGTPQKAETAQYTYEFTAWSPALSDVTAAQKYTAQFSETKKKYDITKATVSDGNSFTVSAESIEWGETITVTPTAAEGYELTALTVTGATTAYSIGDGITKVGDTYTFTMPTENVTVTAAFKKLKYTITWKNWDGQVLTTTEVEHGTVPEYPQNATAPTKESDGEYDYSFKDWSPELTVATAVAEYTATYTSISKEASRTYLDLLTGFSWLKIEKKATAEGNDVVLTVTKDESSQEEIPALKAYIAVYDGGVLQSVKPYTFTSNTVTLPASEATGDYKIFIWTDKYEPVITPITAKTAGNNKLF